MNVTLYTFAKKNNSTKQPLGSTTHASYNGVLREGCSVINPSIDFDIGNTSSPAGYNYAYISDWNRYYFIDDWVYTEGLWTASMTVDVLASFKNQIGDKTLYILRSASSYDDTIIDSLYPMKAEIEIMSQSTGSIKDVLNPTHSYTKARYFTQYYTNGVFILSVVCENATGVTYYQFTYDNFKELVKQLMAFTPSDMSDISTGIAKQLADPMQYIVSCQWYPVKLYPDTEETTTALKFGYYSISGLSYTEITVPRAIYSCYVNIPRHPQALTRGEYLKQSPYSTYTLFFNAFGTIPIDSMKIINDSALSLKWDIDISTGKTLLTISTYTDDDQLAVVEGKMGVNIHLAQITVDTIGAVSNAIGGASAAIGSALRGDALGAGLGIAGAISGAIGASQPSVSSKGAVGSFLSYWDGAPLLVGYFTTIVDEDLDHAGRPLCQEKKINTLTGYVQCRDGDVDIACTESELTSIGSYLTGGFFYE